MNAGRALARAALLALLPLALLSCSRQAPPSPRAQAFDALPRWEGYWASATMVPEIFGFDKQILQMSVGGQGPAAQKATLEGLGRMYPLCGATAPWNDATRPRFFAMLAGMGPRKADGWGFPMMMAGPAPLQFIVTPEETLIVNMYREVRHVYTDGRALSSEEDRWITTWGESIGHWEGDTLVIETVAVRYPPDYFMLAPVLSEKAHYTERIRRTAPDRMESDITIEDPEALTAPWHVKVAYVREKNLDSLVHDAFTNDRSEASDGVFGIEPPKN